MKVDNPETDRLEMPEECDNCGAEVELERIVSYGPGHQVEWYCPFCMVSFSLGKEPNKSMAAMFNVLLEKLNAN